MRILLTEWASGGGAWVDDLPFSGEDLFVRQGHVMVAALAADLRSAGHQIHTFRDARFDESAFVAASPPLATSSSATESTDVGDRERQNWQLEPVASRSAFRTRLVQAAAMADAVLLIAPETGGRLQTCARWLKAFHHKCLFPTGPLLDIGCSKQAFSDLMIAHGVHRGDTRGYAIDAAPGHRTWPAEPSVSLPALLKPDDGCGSEAIRRIDHWPPPFDPEAGKWRLEPWIPGESASVLVVLRPDSVELMEPLRQVLDLPESYHYLRSEPLASDNERRRAKDLVGRAVNALRTSGLLENTRSLVGFDLILHDQDPEQDTLVDFNPRVTTSYACLRERHDVNLAAKLLTGLSPTAPSDLAVAED